MKIQKLCIVLGCLATLVLAGCQSMPTDSEPKAPSEKPRILSAESTITVENDHHLPSPDGLPTNVVIHPAP